MSGPVLAAVAVVTGVMSAKAQIDAGKAQANQFRAEARQTELQGRVEALNFKRQANAVMKQTERVMASNVARAAAGNMNPLASGQTPDLIASLNLRTGVSDANLARSNADMAKSMSKYQADQLRTAAVNANRFARQQAFITIGQSIASAGYLYPTPGFTGNATSTAGASTGGSMQVV
mgnify:CR=1 FL=1|tara:strand:+ start:60 stop:590 length:531 start_codon:yes stop_codon:yes gene_type:complete